MKIITAEEMARLDSKSQVGTDVLMERAGRGMAGFIIENFPKKPVCFICGCGNNGGDGFVAARYLLKKGWEVEVYLYGPKTKLKELPRAQADKLDIEIKGLDTNELEYIITHDKIMVDCILGTGFAPPLDEDLRNIIEIINKKSKIILACDIPTGVNGNTGEADKGAINANVTVTFEYPKIGHVNSPGSEFTGSLNVVKIGTGLSPDKYKDSMEITVNLDCEDYFASRDKISHKKSYGHILIIGGSPGLSGAVALSTMGALKAGAGLVTCGVTWQVAQLISGHSMSAMKSVLGATPQGCIAYRNLGKILDFIEAKKIDCVVIGPGITTGVDQAKIVLELIQNVRCPVVLDADGLNCVIGRIDALNNRKSSLVLTPHIGEMARLIGGSVKVIFDNKEEMVRVLAKQLGCTVVLKGYRTLVTDGHMIYINSTGNPGMATGGSGDILAGIIGALIGEGWSEIDSARVGAWVHGKGADRAAWKLSGRSLLPEDILEEIGKI
ncbi:NAD(P)H-hydrate dehydratase [Elusimicrobiota bacterium]